MWELKQYFTKMKYRMIMQTQKYASLLFHDDQVRLWNVTHGQIFFCIRIDLMEKVVTHKDFHYMSIFMEMPVGYCFEMFPQSFQMIASKYIYERVKYMWINIESMM